MATFKLLAVGDSNTIGPTPPVAWSTWAPRVLTAVQAALTSDTITLKNNAAGSTASYDLYANRATLVEDESPTVVIIAMGGTNDAYYDDPLNGYPRGDGQDYSAASWRARMDTIVAGALALTDAGGRGTRVIVCSAPPAHAQSYPGSLSWRDPVRLEAIRDQAADLVADLDNTRVWFVDLWTRMQENASWQTAYLNTADGGIHLSDAGQAAAAALILPAVLAALKPVEGYGNTTSAGYGDASAYSTTATLTIDPASTAWEQIGTSIVVRTTADASTVAATIDSPAGGLVRLAGTNVGLFGVSLDGVTFSSMVDIPAGETTVYLRVTPVAPGMTLSAQIGIPA